MNKSYRIVWNKARNCLMVVAEFASSQGKGKSVGGAVIGAVAAALLGLGSSGEAEATSFSITTPVTSTQTLNAAGETGVVDGGGSLIVSGASAVNVLAGASISVSGGIIQAPSLGSFGITINVATLTGGISNTTKALSGTTYVGTIGGYAAAIYVTSSLIQGGLYNTGYISSGSSGILLANSVLNNGIQNTVQSNSSGSSVGTISGASALKLTNSTVSGGLTNSGLISGSQKAIAINNSQIDSIYNANSGLITGRDAITLLSALISGSISNAGTVTGQANTGDGALRVSDSTISGNVVNLGHMQAQGAVQLINSRITGSFQIPGLLIQPVLLSLAMHLKLKVLY